MKQQTTRGLHHKQIRSEMKRQRYIVLTWANL